MSFDPTKKRLLSIDGGGIRGVLALGILKELESKLRSETGDDTLVLGDFFDYIAGNSTGAIIASGLSIGKSVDELLKFYEESGEDMFDKNHLLKRMIVKYDADPLAEKLKQVFGENSLRESLPNMRTLLLVVTQNRSTDSVWPISTNPNAVFNQEGDPEDNLQIPFWQLVRASTAAPTYFPPEVVTIDRTPGAERSFVFVDGGVTAYNNPAFLLYKMATVPEYNLGWEQGEEKLMLFSVGTGFSSRPEESEETSRFIGKDLVNAVGAIFGSTMADQDINCRSVGRCVAGSEIDMELGDMVHRNAKGIPVTRPGDERRFLYARYNADISQQGLADLGFDDLNASIIGKMDRVQNISDLIKIGEAVGHTVDLKPFNSFLQ